MSKRLAFLLCAFSSLPAFAEGTGLTVRLGTLGAGAELVKGVSPGLSLRFGANAGSFERTRTKSDVSYDADLRLRMASALADWHPFEGGFRTTAGLMYNANELSLRARPAGNVTIGNTVYTPAQVGSLDGKVDFKKVAPYVGVGWGNAVDKAKTWGFVADFGVLYQRKPNTSLTGTCGSALNAAQCTQFQNDVALERQQLEDDLDEYKWYPVISVGVSYRF